MDPPAVGRADQDTIETRILCESCCFYVLVGILMTSGHFVKMIVPPSGFLEGQGLAAVALKDPMG